MPLIKKKYSDALVIHVPAEINNEKPKNILLLCVAFNCCSEDVEYLFTHSSSEVVPYIGTKYNATIIQKQEHFKNFPENYSMNSIIKKSIVALVIDMASKRNTSNILKWATISALVKFGASAIPILLNKTTTFDELKIILGAGVDVNENLEGFSALHAAVLSQSSQKIELLIAHGANVNSISTLKDLPVGTPLHLALANENFTLAKRIIELANDKIDPNTRDGEQKTLLIIAAKVRSTEVVKLLLHQFKGKIDINAKDDKGRTALHFACAFGCVEMAEALLIAGANINSQDNIGSTPLHYACARIETIRAMLENIEIHPDRDLGAIHNAVIDSYYRPILVNNKELLATKANLTTNLGLLAKTIQRIDNPDILADKEILNLQFKSMVGKSIINYILEQKENVINLLLKYSANVNLANNKGNIASSLLSNDSNLKILLEEKEKTLPELSNAARQLSL